MTRTFIRLCLPLLFSIALSGCGEKGIGSILPLPGLFGDGLAYEVAIEGDIPDDLKDLLKDSSLLVTQRREAPPGQAALTRRVAADLDGFRTVLRSEGYYAADVEATVDDKADPIRIVLTVAPGPRYRLDTYAIAYIGGRDDVASLPDSARPFGARDGMPARGEDVVAIETALLTQLGQTGRPLATVIEREATVDHDTRSMTVVLRVDPGPPVTFGALAIGGLNKVKPDYIRAIVGWREGEIFDQRKLEEIRRDLANTGLFQSVRVTPGDTTAPDNRLPVSVTLEESKHRTLAAGVNYSTAEGVGGELSWEHRNLFGRGERLHLSAEASEIRQQGTASLRKPNFRSRNQTLVLTTAARRQTTDAYEERTGETYAGLERKLSETWTLAGGVSADYSQIHEATGDSSFAVFGLPLNVSRDTTRDFLDPKNGTRLSASVTPYYATLENSVTFTRIELSGSIYRPIGKEHRLVPAIRARLGSIMGAETLEIPANKRFYAGGGGSVRGYSYQSAGPLDLYGDPVGGRSVAETGFDLRWRATDTIGFVPFVEGGTVFDSAIPDFKTDMFWAAGIGLRYFTIAGPIRLDVAWPLNRRPEIDADYQVYVSLGQAF